jgi:1-deoxy-D-xylulose-5-phosphate reductoisomerase
VLNAANEEAVALFLAGQCRFVEIVPFVAQALKAAEPAKELTLDAVIAADQWARAHVRGSTAGRSRLRNKQPA